MSMKTMLIPAEQWNSMSSTLQSALLLARRFDSYIEGFALQPALSELLAVDMGASIAPESFRQDRIEDAKKTKAMFESFMHEHGVPRSDQAVSGLSFGWLDDAPEGEGTVGSYGRLFDLIVLSRPDPTSFGLDRRVLESGLFESGRPILLSPPAPPKQIATNVLIAWNGSTEQTRAIACHAAAPASGKREGFDDPGRGGRPWTIGRTADPVPGTQRHCCDPAHRRARRSLDR